MDPKKFNLWLIIIGIIMLFAGLTSAFIVRMGDGNWLHFELPGIFRISTAIVLLSSITMWFAYRAARKDEIDRLKRGLIFTILLGLGFCISQFYGWKDMMDRGLHFVNPKEGDKISASFVYVISALHLLHILAGILFLLIVLYKTYRLQVHKKETLLINMCNTYWHFVGFLWVYLYLFLYFAPGL